MSKSEIIDEIISLGAMTRSAQQLIWNDGAVGADEVKANDAARILSVAGRMVDELIERVEKLAERNAVTA